MPVAEHNSERADTQLNVLLEHARKLEAHIVRSDRDARKNLADAVANAAVWEDKAGHWRRRADLLASSESFRLGHAVVRPIAAVQRRLRQARG